MEAHERATFRWIADAVRERREGRGWSLDELAVRAGVTTGALIVLENASADPGLVTLVRVADAFGIPITRLLPEDRAMPAPAPLAPAPAPAPAIAIDPAAIPPRWYSESGGMATLLMTVSGASPVEIWHWLLPPGERYASYPHDTGVTKTITVLVGTLELTVDGTHQLVERGKRVLFPADRGHAYGGAGDGCELLVTVHLPATQHS